MGTVAFTVVKRYVSDGANMSLFDLYDVSGELHEIGSTLFAWKTEELRNDLQALVQQPVLSDVLVIQRIEFRPEWRGRGREDHGSPDSRPLDRSSFSWD